MALADGGGVTRLVGPRRADDWLSTVLFGSSAARRAASIDPMVALRDEQGDER
jgi:hypothetical protein